MTLDCGPSSRFEPHDAYSILHGTSSALAYLKTKKVIHNDIKPANIAYSDRAVLLDFGLGSRHDETTGGTPWYVPPDFIIEGTRGARGDVWALGVTMLYVLGKIGLPEKNRSWLIRDARKQGGEAHKRMTDWLKVVARARETLNCADLVEGLVYQMLEPKSKMRVEAAQIFAAFEKASRAVMTRTH